MLYFNARSFPEKSAKTGNLSTIKTARDNLGVKKVEAPSKYPEKWPIW
jgi:hypothetical protein